MEFIDVNRPRFPNEGGVVGNQVVLTNGDSTDISVVGRGTGRTLNQMIRDTPGGQMASAAYIGNGVVLIGDFWLESQATQGNILIHEMVHAYTGLNDDQIFSTFGGSGLVQTGNGTRDITNWLANNCMAP
jgi:hypothetical protein